MAFYRYLLGTILIFVGINIGVINAQDAHFSQFYGTPLYTNPAFSGFFNGKYRLTAVYRDQWRPVLGGSNFKTIYTGLDVRFPMKKKKDAFGGGFMFTHDNAGVGSFASSAVVLSGAFHKVLDMYGEHTLSMGMQYGVTQRSNTYDRITFGDMFNGADGYTGSSAEPLPNNNYSFQDLNAGLVYTWAKEANSFHVGISGAHLTFPDVAFDQGVNGITSKLAPRISGQLGGIISAGSRSRLAYLPRIITFWQGQQLEVNAGTNMRIALSDYNDQALHFGIWGRGARDVVNSFGLDAVVVLAGLELNGFLLGFSFDANVLDYALPGNKRTAFEVSLSYIGNQAEDENAVMCPTF